MIYLLYRSYRSCRSGLSRFADYYLFFFNIGVGSLYLGVIFVSGGIHCVCAAEDCGQTCAAKGYEACGVIALVDILRAGRYSRT